MQFLAILLLSSFLSSAPAINRTDRIPPHDWRFIDLPPDAALATVKAAFVVESGPPVRVTLLEKSQTERWVQGRSHYPLRITMPAFSGSLQMRTVRPGDYAVAIENHDPGQAAVVHLVVALDVGKATESSRQRRLTVIAISFSVFFGIVTLSAAKLWRAAKS